MTKEKALELTYMPTQFEGYGERSLTIFDLGKKLVESGKTLTFDDRYLNPSFKPQSYMTTPFKEIKNMVIADKFPDTYQSLLEKQKPFPNTMSFNDIIHLLKASIRCYIEELWDSDSKKVMFHSGGFDSRIISGILTELREEKGEEWIGEIHFRCHQPEGEMFKQIMKAEGWKPEQYSMWEDHHPPANLYNLGRIEPVNGFLSHIQQYDFFSDIVDENTIVINGIYGGELFDYPARNKGKFKTHKYCDNKLLNDLHNYMLYEGETVSKYMHECKYLIAPFLSFQYLKHATRMPAKHITRDWNKPIEHPDKIRTALVKSFPFDIFNIPYGRHNYTWNTTKQRWDSMQEFYRNSMFYKKYKSEINFPLQSNTFDSKVWAFSVVYEFIHNPEYKST